MMRRITVEMINKYELKRLGYDFMGYIFLDKRELSFHHLIIARRDCRLQNLGSGYLIWNGAILKMNTSHRYLHVIEQLDRDAFLDITSEMIKQNCMGHLSLDCLRRIREILLSFEREYCSARNARNELYIKPDYVDKRIIL